MAFEIFKKRVSALAAQTGASVRFSHDNGQHIARCSGGVLITGNAENPGVTVRWGSGHMAQVSL